MPAGRPTKYETRYVDEAHKLCLLGATDREMADFWGVDEGTIGEWKKRCHEFSGSITRAKLMAGAHVAERYISVPPDIRMGAEDLYADGQHGAGLRALYGALSAGHSGGESLATEPAAAQVERQDGA